MKKIIISESQLKRIIEDYTLNESSEINQQITPFQQMVMGLAKQHPEVKSFCKVGKFDQSAVDNKFTASLNKVFGERTGEFMEKVKSYISTMDKNTALLTIKTLIPYLRKPKEGIKLIKKMIGMEDQVSEQIIAGAVTGIILVAFVGGILYFIISMIGLIFGYGNFTSMIGCQRSY